MHVHRIHLCTAMQYGVRNCCICLLLIHWQLFFFSCCTSTKQMFVQKFCFSYFLPHRLTIIKVYHQTEYRFKNKQKKKNKKFLLFFLFKNFRNYRRKEQKQKKLKRKKKIKGKNA